jgi:MOSC domain-containing protein YiiM
MQLLSLQLGQPQERASTLRDGRDALWTSGIWKDAVSGRVALSRLGLIGDGQADRKNHGGPDKAVCCFCAEHYPKWREMLDLSDAEFPCGAFGENWTVTGLTEDAVCLGDVYAVGTARVQISQPRQPCWKLGRRWGREDLPLAVQTAGQTGYYLRVLEPGEVGAGDPLTLLDRPLPHWTVAALNHAMYVDKANIALADKLGALPLLANAWRSTFRRRAGLIRYQAAREPKSAAKSAWE